MVLLLRFSGLRIRDAVTIRRDRIKDGRLFLYTQKTGQPVSLPLPPHVVTALDAVPKLGGEYLFWSGEGDARPCVADWQRSFRRLCALAGVQNGHFHRFRDTAAVGWLAAGLSVEEVARARSLTAVYRPRLLGAATAKTAFRAGIDLVTGDF